MTAPVSKQQAVLDELRKAGRRGVLTWQLQRITGATNPGTVVSTLRNQGHDILSHKIEHNESRYVLVREKGN